MGDLRSVNLILSYNDTLGTKGTIGFATDDATGIHFDSISYKEYNKEDFE